MRTTLLRFLPEIVAIVLAIAGCGGGGGGDDGGPDPVPDVDVGPPPAAGTLGDGTLDALVEWARATQDVPAMAAVIVQQGQIAEMSAVGRRAADASAGVTVDDRWHLGSLTKAMTSTLAGVLAEQSVVGWDTTPLDVWPELDQSIHTAYRAITLRQLLSHTSGMPNVNSVPQDFEDNQPGTAADKRRAWAAQLLSEPPAVSAGNVLYSNGGYVVAGAMMETLTGTPWETLLEQQVFAPLGMNDTGFGAPGTPGETDQPWGHRDVGTGYEPVSPGAADADNPQALGPAGTVHATLGDYAQFMLAHIAGARGIPGLLTVETFDTLHSGVKDGSALGWGVDTDEDWAHGYVLTHAGSNNRWYAVVNLAPELDAGILMVVNAGGGGAQAVIDSLGELVLERFEASQ